MKTLSRSLCTIVIFGLVVNCGWADNVKETVLEGSNDVKIKIRMEGPITAETPLQVVCLFKHKESGDKMLSTAVDLDKDLQGRDHAAAQSWRVCGRSPGDTVDRPSRRNDQTAAAPFRSASAMKVPSRSSCMEAVGRVAVRERLATGGQQSRLCPACPGPGNSQFGTGDVGQHVIRGLLSAYDTERRLQKEGFAKPYTLEEWEEEAGPAFFDETVEGAKRGISEAKTTIQDRSSKPLASQ